MRQTSLFQGIKQEVVKPVLRPYQQRGVEEMRALVEGGCLQVLLVLPTGGGKTVLAAHIIDSSAKYKKKVLFVAHRIELINQTARQLARFGIIEIGVIRGQDKRGNLEAAVQIASIDTLRNRDLGDWKPDIVFVDEAHRAMAEGYRSLFTRYPDALHIGLTATPFRTDNQGLGELYRGIVRCATYSDLLQDGFIVEPVIYNAPMLPDFDAIAMSSLGDFHQQQLATACMTPGIMGDVVSHWLRLAGFRRTVVFCVNVEHSKALTRQFQEEGVMAAHLDGIMSDEERTIILLKLEKYELQVVCNCDVLSEGWDQPSVKCAVLARPTNSLRLFMQQCGRILRPFDVGTDVFSSCPSTALILDHAGSVERHGLPTQDREFSLTLGEVRKENAPTLHTCQRCFQLWSGSTRECPSCGERAAIKTRDPVVVDERAQLRLVDPNKLATVEDVQRRYFTLELTKAREDGKKPGFAAYRFKDKFSKWPPYAWTQYAKGLFAQDADWQRAVANREKIREHWQARNDSLRTGDDGHTLENSGSGVSDNAGYTEVPEDDIPF